jgi:protein tyrosine/serine phosphatase
MTSDYWKGLTLRIKFLLACLLAGLTLTQLTISASAANEAALQGTAEKSANIPIRNFDEVTPKLWRGALPDQQGLKWLADHDVKTVVDLRAVCTKHEQKIATGLGLQYVRIPLGFGAPNDNSVESFLALAQNAKQPIFVHCRQGEDRTGTLVGVYRMVVEKWPFTRVYKEMRRFGFKPWFFGLRSTVKHAPENFPAAE